MRCKYLLRSSPLCTQGCRCRSPWCRCRGCCRWCRCTGSLGRHIRPLSSHCGTSTCPSCIAHCRCTAPGRTLGKENRKHLKIQLYTALTLKEEQKSPARDLYSSYTAFTAVCCCFLCQNRFFYMDDTQLVTLFCYECFKQTNNTLELEHGLALCLITLFFTN